MRPTPLALLSLAVCAAAFAGARALRTSASASPGESPASRRASSAPTSPSVAVENAVENAPRTPATESRPPASPLAIVTGRVRDADGGPAVGARVFRVSLPDGYRAGGSGSIDGVCDENGRFEARLSVGRPREISLAVRHRRRFDLVLEKVAVSPGETTDLGELRFVAAGSVRVRVFASGGEPQPNVPVSLSERGEGDAPIPPRPPGPLRVPDARRVRSSSTDERGEALFEPVADGRWTVTLDSKSIEFEPRSRTIEVSSGRCESLEWTARNVALLEGTATTGDRPLAGEMLTLVAKALDPPANWEPVRTKTDGSGRFQFPPVPPGEFAVRRGDYAVHFDVSRLAAEADGALPLSPDRAHRLLQENRILPGDELHRVTLRSGLNHADLRFDLAGCAEITVLDAESGEPIRGAQVRLYVPSEFQRSWRRRVWLDRPAPATDRRVRTGPEGRALLEDLPEGRFTVSAHAPGRCRAQGEVSVAAGERAQLGLRLSRGASLRGRVVDTEGKPVRDALVALLPSGDALEPPFAEGNPLDSAIPSPRAAVDDSGSFELTGLPPGPLRLLAFASQHAPTVVEALAEPVTITLERFGRLVVALERKGAPISGAAVRLLLDEKPCPLPDEIWGDDDFFETVGTFLGMSTTTDAQGRMTLERVTPGEWTIVVDVSGTPFRQSARAVAGRDVPILISLP